jgi:DNA-binding NarL/FixJ family response regulator
LIRLLLVEDHAVFRQALENLLLGEPDLRVVAQVGRADEAAEAALESGADLALVDLDLGTGSGVDALTSIREASPSTVCVVLSALTDDVEFGRAIEAGAAAVLQKSIEIPDLLDALRRVAEGAVLLPPVETSRRLRALAAARDQDWHARVLRDRLTPREWEVLERLVQGKGHAEIAADLVISPETAQTHIRNLLAKLAVRSRLEAVVKALRLGLVAPPS